MTTRVVAAWFSLRFNERTFDFHCQSLLHGSLSVVREKKDIRRYFLVLLSVLFFPLFALLFQSLLFRWNFVACFSFVGQVPGIASPLAAFCAAELQRKDAVWTGITSFGSSVPTTPAVFCCCLSSSLSFVLWRKSCWHSPESLNKKAYNFCTPSFWQRKVRSVVVRRCVRSAVFGPLWSVRCGPSLCSVRCCGPSLCSVRCGRVHSGLSVCCGPFLLLCRYTHIHTRGWKNKDSSLYYAHNLWCTKLELSLLGS